jgi:surfeit locus 1 family protein
VTQPSRVRAASVYVFVALALVLAALFVGAGFWQLDRLAQRRERNAALASRLAAAVVPFEDLKDTSSYRRVIVSGSPDYDNEIVYTGRSRQGSPGVYILTPVRRPTSDTAVIVIRGWVYAPDAATADLSRWREPRNLYHGYVAAFPTQRAASGGARNGRKVRTLSSTSVRNLLPYPIAALYVVAQDSASQTTPARLPMPTLDGGSHLSYAVQWFSFATIAIVGAAIIVIRARASRKDRLYIPNTIDTSPT